MEEDRSLCFSTSLREHSIYSRVPCSILHCPLPLPQPPSIGLHCQHHLLPGLRSTNIFSTLHFHYRSPIPQGTNRGGCPRSGTCWHASPLPLPETKPFSFHQGSWYAAHQAWQELLHLHSIAGSQPTVVV
jgi:hypothetical protein